MISAVHKNKAGKMVGQNAIGTSILNTMAGTVPLKVFERRSLAVAR